MCERWKPENGERYYYFYYDGYVDSGVWRNDLTDEQLFERGNCFKTKAEAQAAAEKVKTLLLSFHYNETLQANDETLQTNDETLQDKQLPKLTIEVFDRPDCPDWAQYAAVDSNGAGYYYSEKPFILSDAFGWGIVCSGTNQSEFISGKFNNSDWQNSLIERPAKLPEWCKVGEWVFADPEKVFGHAGYKKIKAIDGLGLTFADGCCIYFSDKIKQARLRPYNADELRRLIGKVIEGEDKISVITDYSRDKNKIYFIGGWSSADEILNGYTIAGKPAGVFQYLENGEWVE